MGIVLEVFGLLVTLALAVAALKRAGVDIGKINPFRQRSKLQTPPLYALEHPVEVVAVLALAAVQTDGVVTTAQKAGVQALLQKHLDLSEADAHDLWIASSHLLRKRALDPDEVPYVLERSADKFTAYHQQTLRDILGEACTIEPPADPVPQQKLQAAVTRFFARKSRGRAW